MGGIAGGAQAIVYGRGVLLFDAHAVRNFLPGDRTRSECQIASAGRCSTSIIRPCSGETPRDVAAELSNKAIFGRHCGGSADGSDHRRIYEYSRRPYQKTV